MLRVETTDYGWWYLCPGDGKNAFACCVTDGLGARAAGIAHTRPWNDRFKTTNISRQFGNSATASVINAISASTVSLPLKQGEFWIIAGDAAVKLDPLGSSGTITAIESGRRAATAVADALNGKMASVENYERWNNGLIETFVRQRNGHYAIQIHRYDEGFWHRRADRDIFQKSQTEDKVLLRT